MYLCHDVVYDVVKSGIQDILGLVFSVIPPYGMSIGVDALTSSENDAEVKTREPVSAVLFESGPAILCLLCVYG